jgi:hypothetical protein
VRRESGVGQCCPTFLYIWAHLTDGDSNNNNNNNNKVILIKITTDFIFMTVFPEIF